MDWLGYLLFLLVGVVLGRVGSKTPQGNTNTLPEVKTPKINPLEAYKEHKEKKELEQVQKEFNIMWGNIDNYDGTSNGQQEVR